jgi:hypothetical protein
MQIFGINCSELASPDRKVMKERAPTSRHHEHLFLLQKRKTRSLLTHGVLIMETTSLYSRSERALAA